MSESTASSINLFLVNGHVMFREGLAMMLERQPGFSVVGQGGLPAEAGEIVEANRADVVLLDADLGPELAIEFVDQASRQGFQGQFLVITAGVNDAQAIRLIQSGVSGILHKHNSLEVLFRTIRQVAAGEVSLERIYMASLLRSLDPPNVKRRLELSDCDRDILRLIVSGLSNRQIGEQLSVSISSVKTSVRHMYEMLNVRTKPQLVRIALERYRDYL